VRRTPGSSHRLRTFSVPARTSTTASTCRQNRRVQPTEAHNSHTCVCPLAYKFPGVVKVKLASESAACPTACSPKAPGTHSEASTVPFCRFPPVREHRMCGNKAYPASPPPAPPQAAPPGGGMKTHRFAVAHSIPRCPARHPKDGFHSRPTAPTRRSIRQRRCSSSSGRDQALPAIPGQMALCRS
jgi:hypothetical protein